MAKPETAEMTRPGTVAASLIVRNADAALRFYAEVFGARELYRLTTPDGLIAHAEFAIGDCVVMLGSEHPDWHNKSPLTLGGSPIILNVMVDDPDAVIAKAEAAGAKVLFPAADHFYGYRSGRIQDPEGHMWMVSKIFEEVSPEEMQRRMEEMIKTSS
jgi:PhnB protein